MKAKNIFLFLFVFVLVSGVAIAIPGFPHQYYGSVTYNGNPANNLAVDVKIDGNVAESTTSSNGFYSLKVSNINNDKNGKTLRFFVNNIDTGTTIVYNSEESSTTEVSLAASGPSGDGGGSGGGGGGGSSGGGGGGSSNKKTSDDTITPVIPKQPSEDKKTPEKTEEQNEAVIETTQTTEEAGFFERLWNTITGNLVTGQVIGSIENISITRNLIIIGIITLIILLGFFGFKTFYRKRDN